VCMPFRSDRFGVEYTGVTPYGGCAAAAMRGMGRVTRPRLAPVPRVDHTTQSIQTEASFKTSTGWHGMAARFATVLHRPRVTLPALFHVGGRARTQRRRPVTLQLLRNPATVLSPSPLSTSPGSARAGPLGLLWLFGLGTLFEFDTTAAARARRRVAPFVGRCDGSQPVACLGAPPLVSFWPVCTMVVDGGDLLGLEGNYGYTVSLRMTSRQNKQVQGQDSRPVTI